MTEAAQIYTKDYYDRLKAIERGHWWTLGSIDAMDALLRGRTPEAGAFFDLGCGSGIGLRWARERMPRARRVGLDVSPHALAHCADLDAELVLAGGEGVPLPDASFDLGICLDVLQHVPDDRPVLAEVRRVLKPGGVFFVRTNARGWTPPPPGSRVYDARALGAALEGAGLVVERLSRVNCVGSLVAEVGRLRARRADGAGAHGDHRHDAAPGARDAVDPAATPSDADRFKGGGYGGGLRLTAEDPTRLGARLKRALLRWEGAFVARGGRLPFGHSLVARARRPL